ncbi:hypothetical protein [uncultured Campylobacter sp.]|uniref:hypothetical protein n=1 Tax=uncultured Campylobacter sp. TaxID=218934 RepID=UPI0026251AB2|nr:hypothetical protein [uncultured Campylobacter sp.]
MRLLTQSGFGALYSFASFAQARTYLCVDWVYERTSFGGDFVSSEQALVRLIFSAGLFLV